VEGTPWFVEAKEGKTHRIWAAVRQAVEARDAAKDDRPIVVISHRTRGLTLAVVPYDDWTDEVGELPWRHLRQVATPWEAIARGYPTAVTNQRTGAEVVVMLAANFVELLKR
jgi:hypothetical protein